MTFYQQKLPTEGAAHRRRRRTWLLVLLVVVLLMIAAWIGRRPILRESAALWVVSDPLGHADAIAVLGGGDTLRPLAAASLYKDGLAGKILVANVKPSALEKLGLVNSHVEFMRRLLLRLGVPQDAIFDFGNNVQSSFDEARALAVWAKNSGAHTIIVPTEMFSTRRQRWILNHELGAVGSRVIIDALTPSDYQVDDWWRHSKGLVDFQTEVIKYVYYRLKY
ncbi:MAG TPA: YdcF family protein [Bradyrhizobium sp.]|nr:YdcF family protein [Bradyrhizobium sp.]